MSKKNDSFFNPDEFVPELRQEFDKTPLNLKVAWRVFVPAKKEPGLKGYAPVATDRTSVVITDGTIDLQWTAPSLRALFRGDRPTPVLGDVPEGYDDVFALLELQLLEVCKIFGDRRDAEMKEIYAALRKRPDGKSQGYVHDQMWRAAALVLGTHILSQGEFEAIMSRLERSCRTFEQSASSRNYVAAIRMVLGREG
jgi:hypothetical protein